MTLSSLVLVSALAWADLPPPDGCPTAGQTCDNAGPGHDQPGTCQAAKCTRASPDGPVEYDCSRCVASANGGSGGSGGGAAAGGSSAGGRSSAPEGGGGAASDPQPTSAKSDDGGCTLVHQRPGSATVLAGIGLGLLMLARARRR
jgi:hypothetical protein